MTVISNKSGNDGQYFAVIDTETNYYDEVISIGVVIAHRDTYRIIDEKYYIITPECYNPAMFSDVLNDCPPHMKCERSKALLDLHSLLLSHCVNDIFAYNAKFDYNHLPELKTFTWHDIMSIAAYKQYNSNIPSDAECCSTGRLKSNYSVEAIMRMLIKNEDYFEKHNAMHDAKDELLIMQLIGYPVGQYPHIKGTPALKEKAHV